MESLVVGDCRISNRGLQHLQKLPNLTELRILLTQVTDEGLKELAGFKNLKKLSLSSIWITDEAVDQLQKELPDLVILR